MTRENIIKHLRCPDPTGQEDWEKRIEQAYHGTHSRWTENLHQSFLGFAIDAICDRCESLEQENARLREELAKSRLTWSDEEPTEEGWYWVESTTGVSRMMEYFLGIYATGIYSITACTPDGKPRRNCRIPEPQEPSE